MATKPGRSASQGRPARKPARKTAGRKTTGRKAASPKPAKAAKAKATVPAAKATPAAAPARGYSLAWSRNQKAAFLTTLADSANVTLSARAAGKSTSAAYGLRQRDPVFAQSWREALEQALDQLEAHIIARAGAGIERDYFYQGETKGVFREYSDALAMFMLRARRPDIYGKTSMTPETTAPAQQRAQAVKDIILARLQKLQDEKRIRPGADPAADLAHKQRD